MTDQEFYERLQRCTSTQEIQNLCQQRAIETPGSGVTRDADGILHGSDQRVELSSDLVGEEKFEVAGKMLTISGTSRQRAEQKAALLKNGLDVSKCRRIEK